MPVEKTFIKCIAACRYKNRSEIRYFVVPVTDDEIADGEIDREVTQLVVEDGGTGPVVVFLADVVGQHLFRHFNIDWSLVPARISAAKSKRLADDELKAPEPLGTPTNLSDHLADVESQQPVDAVAYLQTLLARRFTQCENVYEVHRLESKLLKAGIDPVVVLPISMARHWTAELAQKKAHKARNKAARNKRLAAIEAEFAECRTLDSVYALEKELLKLDRHALQRRLNKRNTKPDPYHATIRAEAQLRAQAINK